MATSRYSIAFIFLLSIFSFGIALYTVLIEKNTYRLATAILIEDRKDTSISVEQRRGFCSDRGLETGNYVLACT